MFQSVRRLYGSPIRRIMQANLTVQALGLATTVVTAALLGVDEFGALTAIVLWWTFLPQLLNLGVPDTMVSLSRESRDVRRVYTNGLWVTACMSAFCALILTGLSLWGPIDGSPVAIVGACAVMGLSMVSGCLSSLEQRLQNFGAYNRLLVLTSVATFGALVPAWFFPELRSLEYVVLTRAIGIALPVLFTLVRRRNLLLGLPDLTFRSIVTTGARFHVTGSISAVSSRVDQLVASLLLSNSALGLLGLILPFTQALKSVPTAFSTVGLVRIVESVSPEAQKSQFRRTLKSSSVITFSLVVPIGLGCFCVLWLQSALSASLEVEKSIALLIIVYIFGAAVAGIVDLIIRLDRAIAVFRRGIWARLVSAIIGLLVALPVIGAFGLWGAAAVSVLASVVALVCLWLMRVPLVVGKARR